MIAQDRRVGDSERWHKTTSKLTDEERRWSPIWCDIVGDRRVGNRDITVSLEDRSAMPTGRNIAVKNAVGDGHVAE